MHTRLQRDRFAECVGLRGAVDADAGVRARLAREGDAKPDTRYLGCDLRRPARTIALHRRGALPGRAGEERGTARQQLATLAQLLTELVLVETGVIRGAAFGRQARERADPGR